MPTLPPSDGLVDQDGIFVVVDDLASSQRIDVKTDADISQFLSAGVYTIPAGTTFNLLEDLDITPNQIIFEGGCSLNGVSRATVLSGTNATDVALLENLGNLQIKNITILQNGGGDALKIDAEDSVVEIFNVDMFGRIVANAAQLLQMAAGSHTSTLSSVLEVTGTVGFIILESTQLLWPQLAGAICINFTDTAVVDRCTLNTATPFLRDLTEGAFFADVPNSIGIRVAEGASIQIFSQINAGMRPESTNSRHLVVEDPTSVDFGLLEGNSFDNASSSGTGTLYGCEPQSPTPINYSEISYVAIRGMTYDTKDIIYISFDSSAALLTKADGVAADTGGETMTTTNDEIFDLAYYKNGDLLLVADGAVYRSDEFTTFDTNGTWTGTELRDSAGGGSS